MPQMPENDAFSTLTGWVEKGGEGGDKTFSTTTPYRVGGGGGGGSHRGGGGVTNRCLIPFDRREGLTTAEAAERADRTERTIRMWCRDHDIGRHVAGGPWLVSRVALAMFLNGDAEALQAYLAGDRAGPTVAPYFLAEGLGDLIRA